VFLLLLLLLLLLLSLLSCSQAVLVSQHCASELVAGPGSSSLAVAFGLPLIFAAAAAPTSAAVPLQLAFELHAELAGSSLLTS
jgi:hypothetical protein